MKNKTISVIAGVILVIIVGTLVYLEKASRIPVSYSPTTETPATTVTSPTTSVVTTGTTKPVTSLPTTPKSGSGTPVSSTPTPTPAPTPTPTPAPTPVQVGITLAQVSQHNSRTSCWSAINGIVYDLTSWIPNHPGGEGRILKICGKDGSSSYNGEHGGSSRIGIILEGFKLDVLAR